MHIMICNPAPPPSYESLFERAGEIRRSSNGFGEKIDEIRQSSNGCGDCLVMLIAVFLGSSNDEILVHSSP